MRSRIDLHIHSTYSDGLLSPQKIVYLASRRHVRAISITDHDNISGIKPAIEYGKKIGIEVIPGVELSAQEGNNDIHFLGYFLQESVSQLQDYLSFLRVERYKRAQKILAALNRVGISIGFDEVLQKSSNGSIGRPHIADVLIQNGFVENRGEAFYKYIGDRAAAFVPRYILPSKKAIDLIHSAGGISVVAHPNLDTIDKYLPYWVKKCGLDGIEVIHPRYSSYQIHLLQKYAHEYNLIQTGGSDCHGNRDGKIIIGDYYVPLKYLTTLKNRLADLAPKTTTQPNIRSSNILK